METKYSLTFWNFSKWFITPKIPWFMQLAQRFVVSGEYKVPDTGSFFKEIFPNIVSVTQIVDLCQPQLSRYFISCSLQEGKNFSYRKLCYFFSIMWRLIILRTQNSETIFAEYDTEINSELERVIKDHRIRYRKSTQRKERPIRYWNICLLSDFLQVSGICVGKIFTRRVVSFLSLP
jgi:hypothetical protein